MEYPDLWPVSLEGDGVLLREFTLADAPAAFVWANDPEYFRYLTGDAVETEAEVEGLIGVIEALAHERPRRHYILGIAELAETLIGVARLDITAPEHGEGVIGYGLRRDRWGCGLATAAAASLLDFAFRELGLHRVSASRDPDNVASRRVMQKLGMTEEGTLRGNVLDRGVWLDAAVHSVLEHEWRGVH